MLSGSKDRNISDKQSKLNLSFCTLHGIQHEKKINKNKQKSKISFGLDRILLTKQLNECEHIKANISFPVCFISLYSLHFPVEIAFEQCTARTKEFY